MTKLESIKKHGESAKGRKELINYLKGKSLNLQESVLARCYDCMSYYADGVADCKALDCPLYAYMPYRTLTRAKTTAKKALRKKPERAKQQSLKEPPKETARELVRKIAASTEKKNGKHPADNGAPAAARKKAPQPSPASPKKKPRALSLF